MRYTAHTRCRSVLQGAPSRDRWLLSYADFVTLLFAVFVVLFAFAIKQKQPVQALSSVVHDGFSPMASPAANSADAAPANKEHHLPDRHSIATASETGQLYSQLHSILGDAISQHEIVMQQTPNGLIISLRELGFFACGDATLLPGAAGKIAAAAEVLKAKGFEIRVEGHSDDQPIHSALYQSNWELSIARAMSVLRLLVEDAGFPENRISAAGYGPFRPVASNLTSEGRKQNRRVDLVVILPRELSTEQP